MRRRAEVDNASLMAKLPHLGLSIDAIMGAFDVDRR